jgi:hypothetical protein
MPDTEHPPGPEASEVSSPQPLPTSELLIHLVGSDAHDAMTVGELIDGLGGRAFSIIFLLLTLPIAVPGPPGLPVAFAIPLLILTTQLLFGRSTPWLPGIVRRRKFSRKSLLAVLHKVKPMLARIESVCRPRLTRLSDGHGQRWIGAFMFLCAFVMTNPVPIPFSHLPLAFGMALLSLGFVERDGVIIIVSALVALAGIAINLSLTGGVLVLGFKFLHLG